MTDHGEMEAGGGTGRSQLGERDRRIVREARAEIRDAPPPRFGVREGIAAAGTGAVVLFVWPQLSHRVPGGAFLGPLVLLVGALLLIGGLAWVLGGVRVSGQASETAVEAALRQLGGAARDREADLRAATLLVSHGWRDVGGAWARVVEVDVLRERVGSTLPLVEEVEALLHEDEGLRPVSGTEGQGPAAGGPSPE